MPAWLLYSLLMSDTVLSPKYLSEGVRYVILSTPCCGLRKLKFTLRATR